MYRPHFILPVEIKVDLSIGGERARAIKVYVILKCYFNLCYFLSRRKWLGTILRDYSSVLVRGRSRAEHLTASVCRRFTQHRKLDRGSSDFCARRPTRSPRALSRFPHGQAF
ncbi:hypothetical protein PUN28_007494 [Cardiocondyla obscurior]|uniref:Uncharacterized protein n=1 Tax=Cardiocondyla obscurior TaxID=286306 RepID=A0AAW2G7A2_9HYME